MPCRIAKNYGSTKVLCMHPLHLAKPIWFDHTLGFDMSAHVRLKHFISAGNVINLKRREIHMCLCRRIRFYFSSSISHLNSWTTLSAVLKQTVLIEIFHVLSLYVSFQILNMFIFFSVTLLTASVVFSILSGYCEVALFIWYTKLLFLCE